MGILHGHFPKVGQRVYPRTVVGMYFYSCLRMILLERTDDGIMAFSPSSSTPWAVRRRQQALPAGGRTGGAVRASPESESQPHVAKACAQAALRTRRLRFTVVTGSSVSLARQRCPEAAVRIGGQGERAAPYGIAGRLERAPDKRRTARPPCHTARSSPDCCFGRRLKSDLYRLPANVRPSCWALAA